MQSQPSATDIHVRHDRYSDIDRQAAQLSGYGQIYRQLSRGAFAGSFTTLETADGAGIYVEKVNQVIEQGSSVPDGQASLVFLCGDQSAARFGARPFAPGTAMLLGAGAEIDFQSCSGTHVCVLTHSTEALGQDAGRQGVALPGPGQTRLLDDAQTVGRLVRQIGMIAQSALLTGSVGPDMMGGPFLSAEIGAIMLAMSGLASAGLVDRMLPLHRRASLFRQARRTIHDRLDMVTVTQLQTRLHVSRRTLEYIFREATGMTPHAYIAAMRLDAARRAIKSDGDSIGDIAARYGIWHLGRFARQFREAFGTLPSEMRGAGRQPAGEAD